MSTVTPRLGLVKPTTLEQYALSVLNNNADLIDAAAVLTATANSSYNTNSVSGLSSKFTRMATGAVGIIIAEIAVDFDNVGGIIIAANTAASTHLPAFIPAGFRPASTPHSFPVSAASMVKNGGQGQILVCGPEAGTGDIMFNTTAAAYTAPTGSDFNCFMCWRWDGSL